jgi:hypothetical protein
MWGTLFAFQPERTLIVHSCIKEEPPLPDRGAASINAESYALAAILECEVRNLNFAASEIDSQYVEIFALEPRRPESVRRRPVLHGMIDVLEKLPGDPLMDASRDTIGIDQQYGNLRLTFDLNRAG